MLRSVVLAVMLAIVLVGCAANTNSSEDRSNNVSPTPSNQSSSWAR